MCLALIVEQSMHGLSCQTYLLDLQIGKCMGEWSSPATVAGHMRHTVLHHPAAYLQNRLPTTHHTMSCPALRPCRTLLSPVVACCHLLAVHHSLTPTFAAVAMFINNSRWEGVPFLMKAGKALHKRYAEVRVQFW
jgi:hypothetical protein